MVDVAVAEVELLVKLSESAGPAVGDIAGLSDDELNWYPRMGSLV